MFVVLCNCRPTESAELAKALVSEGLAACVNVIPGVTSYYVWDDSLQQDGEHTLLIKVAADKVEALSTRIRALHSYTVPEILALPVDTEHSNAAYVRWVKGA